MGNVRDLGDQSVFALSRLLVAEVIDWSIKVYLLFWAEGILSLCLHSVQDNYSDTKNS